MKIMIFLHGTTIMHKSALGKFREERVKQSLNRQSSVLDYGNYMPTEGAVEKLKNWESQGAEIFYLSSHETSSDVEKDKTVLDKYSFPKGLVFFREDKNTKYSDLVERILPDVLIEDDCESIGGEMEMTYPQIRIDLKPKIKHIVVKEFQGIAHLPDNLNDLKNYAN